MAFSLAEYKKQSQDPLIAGIYEIFMNNSPILDRMEFSNINGGAVSYNRETTLPTTAFRAVGSAYSTSEGVITTSTESLTIAGGKITLDRILEKWYGQDRRNTSVNMQIKSLARLINYTMFKGDGTSNTFTGLENRVAAGQTVDNGTGALSLGSFDEALADLEGDNQAIFVGKGLWLRLTAALRDATVSGNLMRVNDDIGRPMMVYGGVPIYRAGQDASDAEVLDFSEATSTTSAYFCSFDDNGIQGVQNGGIEAYTPVTDSVANEFDIEWSMNYIIGNLNSAIRVSGITDAAVVA